MYSREAINANMTSLARTTELHWLETNRTNTATTGTITDSFNNTTITDTSVQNGA